MNTRDLIKLARDKGLTIKTISELTDINVRTLYSFNCGCRELSKEKEEKIKQLLFFLLDT